MTLGTLYIVSAPSGAGKTSLITAMLETVKGIKVSVSHTTRPMREGEVDGQHYHFVDKEAFEKDIEKSLFLEHADVFGNYYGTSHTAVNDQLSQGIDVILEIDWQGAQQIRQLAPNTRSIFVLPPSISELENRLTKRNQDAADVIAKRVAQAKEDVTHYNEYDHVIINKDFDTALTELKSIFISPRTQREKLEKREPDMLKQLMS
ncbi:guanylate kinase [Leucothrix arctica]|uniref:Guanylate kinase n=1 Tax=Leucothrix arctica TaxID=1481894 RepID=A0A317C7H9_9GAMM|nr:guanylate kinase [Leucothrix arctica]PWQ94269.1 guanylate kinase [Leucothrix arctica]